MMGKIKVGFLPLYIKLYDDTDPKLRDPMVAHMEKMIPMLEAHGLELVRTPDLCCTKEQFEQAVQSFNDSDVAAVITLHLAYSPSLESIDALLRLKAPIVVLDTTPDYELLSVAKTENRIMSNHGIHGVQDMCSMLKRNGKAYYLCAGHVDHSDVIAEVAGLCRAAAVKKAYETMRIGSVGGSFTGMGDFLISDERYKQDIGAQVTYMTPEVVKEYYAKVTDAEAEAEMAKDRERYDVDVTYLEEYKQATKSGLAVRKWMEENKLDSITINFLTLDICGLPKMPFPECCKVLERGQGYAGEGDVLTAGLVGSLFAAYPETTLTEMFCPDWEKDVILMSHMGESNPNLAQWKPHIRNCEFGYNSCGNTVGMYTCAKEGAVTLLSLVPMKDSFTLVLCPGKMLNVGLEDGAYQAATQGWFKPNKPVAAFLKEYSMAGGTHHCAMVYDVPAEELEAFGEMMGFEVAMIK